MRADSTDVAIMRKTACVIYCDGKVSLEAVLSDNDLQTGRTVQDRIFSGQIGATFVCTPELCLVNSCVPGFRHIEQGPGRVGNQGHLRSFL